MEQNLKKNLLSACENYKYMVAKTNIKRLPIEQIEDAYGMLNKIDLDSIKIMCNGKKYIKCWYEPHCGEHSAENELPFVQRAFHQIQCILWQSFRM